MIADDWYCNLASVWLLCWICESLCQLKRVSEFSMTFWCYTIEFVVRTVSS